MRAGRAPRAKLNAADAALNESKARRRKAEADVKAVKSRLEVAQALRNQSAAWLDYRNIRAPFDGIVTLRNVHTGHFLQSASSGTTNKSAEPLLVLMRMDIMRVVVQVPEKDAVLVKDGDLANVAFQALPERSVPEPRTGLCVRSGLQSISKQGHAPLVVVRRAGPDAERGNSHPQFDG